MYEGKKHVAPLAIFREDTPPGPREFLKEENSSVTA